MSYICFSDYIEYNMPDEKDIYLLFKAVISAVHNVEVQRNISVNIENITYDRSKGSIRFVKCRCHNKNPEREIDELIKYLSLRLRYANDGAYTLIMDIKNSFRKDGIHGIHNVLAEYGNVELNNEKIFSMADLLFIAGIIITHILYYKITGISFFK